MQKRLTADYWDKKIEISVPGDVTLGEIPNPHPLPDPEKAIREAIAHPIAAEPLSELAKKARKGKVTIAFDDPFRPAKPRQLIMSILIEELIKAGIKEENILLVCASGMHCKRTPAQLREYLGPSIFDRFSLPGSASRVLNHDCHDPEGLVYMGVSETGDYVEHNRLLLDSDLFIYSGAVHPMPWGGLSGTGAVVGLASTQSIPSTHGVSVIDHPDSCHGNHRTSLFRAHKQAIMKQIEKFTGKRVFYVDMVLGAGDDIAGVFAGYSPEINEPSWQLAENIFQLEVPQADVFIIGLPRFVLYGETSNPLISLSVISTSFRCWVNKPPIRDGGVVIALTACDGTIDERSYPAHREIIDLYKTCFSVEELSIYEEAFRYREDLIFKYRHCYAYAPAHGFWLFNESQYMLDTASKVIFAGVPGMNNPLCTGGLARRTGGQGATRDVGCVPAKDFDHAWKLTEQIVGKKPKVLACPQYWTRPGPQFVVK